MDKSKKSLLNRYKWGIPVFQSFIYIPAIIIFIPLTGLFLSYYNPCYNMAFARSGSVLVAFVIFCTLINQKINEIATRQRSLGEAKVVNATNLEQAKKIQEGFKQFSDQSIKLSEVSKMIIYFEFLAGVIGTLIWGFGDIPFSNALCLTN